MNTVDEGILASCMDEHLDEYLVFYNLCRSKKHIDESEIQMLWETWCVKTMKEQS